jgi:hypothetical protein
MKTRHLLVATIAAGALLVPALVQAQQQAEGRVFIPGQGQGTLTLFERQNFGGQAITFRQGEGSVRIPFQVRSIIAEGGWRVCSDTNGRGSCIWADQRYPQADRFPGVNFTVRSVIPQSGNNGGNWGGGGGNNDGWFGPVGGQTLRGSVSQFWPAPEINRRRVDACPNGNNGNTRCAAETADRFCRFAGWRSATFHNQVSINRRWFLSDVLCTNR